MQKHLVQFIRDVFILPLLSKSLSIFQDRRLILLGLLVLCLLAGYACVRVWFLPLQSLYQSLRAGRRGELRVLPQKYFKEDIGADSPFLNKKQTCNYLSVSNNTLDIWIAMGLPYIRIGKSIRFSKESINQWMTRFEIST